MKRILSGILVASLVFTYSGGAQAASQNTKLLSEQSEELNHFFSETKDIFGEDGEVIGEEVINVFRKVEVDENDTKKVTITKQVEEKYIDDRDSIKSEKTFELEITSDGKYFINGEKLSEKFLQSPVYEESNNENKSSKKLKAEYDGQSGGIYNICSYDEINKRYYKLVATPDADDYLERGKGKRLTKYSYNDENVSDFKRYCDKVEDARGDLREAQAELAVVIGVALVTWEMILPLIAEGAAGAVLAYKIYDSSTSGREDLETAYNILKNDITPY